MSPIEPFCRSRKYLAFSLKSRFLDLDDDMYRFFIRLESEEYETSFKPIMHRVSDERRKSENEGYRMFDRVD